MGIDEVLAKATPRPWFADVDNSGDICAGPTREQILVAYCDPLKQGTQESNRELAVTAVNAYERQQEVIAELVRSVEVMLNSRTASGEIVVAYQNNVNAALAKAKEVLNG